MKQLTLLCFVTALTATVFGQHALGLRMHRDVLQAYHLLPQNMVGDTSWMVGLPSAGFYIGNSGFSYNDIVATDGDSAYLTYDKMISGLAKNNYLTASASLPFITLARRWGQWQVAVHQAENISVNARYTRVMAEFLWYGNTRFIGQRVNLAPDLEMLRYYETSLTAARQFGNLSVGGSIKYLEGVACISVQGNEVSIYTEPVTYNLEVKTNIEVNRSNTKKIARIGAFPEQWFRNPGVALDLGASYRYADRWLITGSLLSLGYIRWRTDIKSLRSESEFQFTGIDLSGFILGDSLDVQEYEDSLSALLNFTEQDGSFTSFNIPRFNAGLNYTLGTKYEVGIFSQTQFLNGGSQSTISLSGSRGFSLKRHFFKLGAHYAYRNRSPYGFGLSGEWKWRFLQVFAMSDNVIAWFMPKAKVPLRYFDTKNEDSIIIPKHMKSFNFRFGINVVLKGRAAR